jgi:anthrone oxygenase-like protein
MIMLLDLVTLLSLGLFAGAALYVTLVEHPARLRCGPALAIAEFGPSYRRGAVMQASLAALGCLAGVGDWARGHGVLPLAAGLLMAAVIAFTLVVILPTNKRLLDPALDSGSAEAATVLARWGRLHAVRTVLGGAALLLQGLHLVGAR